MATSPVTTQPEPSVIAPAIARTGSHVVASKAPADLTESGLRRVVVVAGVMLAALLQTLDGTIVNVALPTIQGNLGASIDEGAWVVTAYIIAAVVVIPITPWLQNRFGRKQYFLVSIAGFTIASLACGLAGSIQELIVFRIVQGLFGGGLLATAQAILRDTFPPKQLGLSQSIFTIAAVIGPSSGPTIGGILTDNVSWRWVFDVNVVPGIVAMVLLIPTLRSPKRTNSPGFDAIGLALLAVGLGSFQYVLDEGERNDWFNDPLIALLTFTAAAGTAAFVAWELWGTARPIVDLRVLAKRAVGFGCLLAMVNASVVFGQLLAMPQFLTAVLGFTATQDGLLLAVRALPIVILTIPIGALANSSRIDPRLLIAGGLALAGAGVVGLGFVTTTGSAFSTIVPWLVCTGCGIALVFSPLLVAVLRNVQPAQSPKAGAFISLSLNLGGSIASASLVTLLDRRESFHSTILAAHATLANGTVNRFIAEHGAGALAAIVDRESLALAYADAFFVIGGFAIVMAPLAFAMPRVRSAPGAEKIHASE